VRVFISLTQALGLQIRLTHPLDLTSQFQNEVANHMADVFVFRNKINFVKLPTRIGEKLIGN
jgi:hypothetical protein